MDQRVPDVVWERKCRENEYPALATVSVSDDSNKKSRPVLLKTLVTVYKICVGREDS